MTLHTMERLTWDESRGYRLACIKDGTAMFRYVHLSSTFIDYLINRVAIVGWDITAIDLWPEVFRKSEQAQINDTIEALASKGRGWYTELLMKCQSLRRKHSMLNIYRIVIEDAERTSIMIINESGHIFAQGPNADKMKNTAVIAVQQWLEKKG